MHGHTDVKFFLYSKGLEASCLLLCKPTSTLKHCEIFVILPSRNAQPSRPSVPPVSTPFLVQLQQQTNTQTMQQRYRALKRGRGNLQQSVHPICVIGDTW